MAFYVSRHATQKRPATERPPRHVIARIEKASQLEIKLHKLACRWFDESCQLIVDAEPERFRRWNGIYDRLAAPLILIRRNSEGSRTSVRVQ